MVLANPKSVPRLCPAEVLRMSIDTGFIKYWSKKWVLVKGFACACAAFGVCGWGCD
jgi:hypothetical protein